MVENAINSDEKKHQDDENRRKSFSDQRKRIYLVNNIFEAWENAKIDAGCKRCSDSDFAAKKKFVKKLVKRQEKRKRKYG